jgi:NTE family protein
VTAFSGWLRRVVWKVRPPVLALGGGGARGFAHIGMLQALQEAGVRPRRIAGTSAGAVVGAMYLAYGSVEAIRERWKAAFDQELIPTIEAFSRDDDKGAQEHFLLQAARRIRDRVVISLAINRSTVLDGKALEQALDFLLPDVSIEDLPGAFVAVATDLETGDEVRLASGDLRTAVLASSSIPGLVPPVEIDGRLLVDGGVVAEVPVAAARALGRPLLAADVAMDLPAYRSDRLVLETMARTGLMTSALLRGFQLRDADVVLNPHLGPISWSEWDHFDELVNTGYKAARALLGRD